MIRVGFVFEQLDEGWLGGVNYFSNLLNAIYTLPDRKIEPVVFIGLKTDMNMFRDFPPVEVIRSGMLDVPDQIWQIRDILFAKSGNNQNLRGWISSVRIILSGMFDTSVSLWVFRYITKNKFGYDGLLERLLRKHNISLLSHAGFLGTHARIPSLGWIPDFQHLHLKDVFNDNEIKSRDRDYKNICRRCATLLLSSYDARKDLADFAPDCVDKTHVLQFVAGLNSKVNIPSLDGLENRHKFKSPFFYVPNQFWGHKNHRVIIEALHILKKTGRDVLVLSTGNANDYRQPDLIKSLCAYIEENNLSENFRMLGLVPRSDVIALMRYSLALINPSFFEGWSTTVEEAKSMGKRIILSDIDVHKEQNPPGGIFFNPKDPNDLAEKMWSLWTNRAVDAEQKLMEQAIKDLPLRRLEFAKKYEDIVLSIVRNN